MRARKIISDDYETLCYWWKSHNHGIVPKTSLPLTGFIVEDDKYQYCAGFLYKTDSDVALIEGFVSNKDTDYSQRSEALDVLIQELMNEAKRDNYRILLAQVTNKHIIKKCEKFNFHKMTQECVNYFKEV